MANQMLIQGAGQAVKRFKGTTAAAGISAIGEVISKGGAKIAGMLYDRGEEFDKAAKSALESAEFMEPKRYEKLVKELMAQKQKYIWGSSTDRALLEQDLNKRTLELGEMEMLTTDIAEAALKDEKLGGLRTSFKEGEGPLNQDILEILNKQKEYVYNEDNQSYGFEMRTGEWTSDEIENLWEKYNSIGDVENEEAIKIMNQIEKLENEINEDTPGAREKTKWMSRADVADIIKKNSFNKTTHDLVGVTYGSIAEAASKLKPNESRDFKEKVWSDWTLRNVVEADKHAAINDPLILNKSFKEHLFDHLKDKTYGDLNITNEDLLAYEGFDPDGEGGLPPISIDDGIDEDDARQLSDAMCEDETNPALVGEGGLLQRFFTQHFKDAHNEGIKFTAKAEVPPDGPEIEFNPLSKIEATIDAGLKGLDKDDPDDLETIKNLLDMAWTDGEGLLDGDGGDQVRLTLEKYRKDFPFLTEHWGDIKLTGGEGTYTDEEEPTYKDEFKDETKRKGTWSKGKKIRYYKYLYWLRFGKHVTKQKIMDATNNWADSWEQIDESLLKGFPPK
mgnify:CR=1 FL=1|tara:strand:- start:4837 stop:6519 length:1683 start_codon:yes stop_codon:yes gene_type:complete